MSDSSDNKVRRTETEDGAVVYSIEVNADTERMISTAAKFHSCKREATIATALSFYLLAFEESVKLAIARADGTSH